MNPAIVGPATGIVIGGLCFASYLVWSLSRGAGSEIDPVGGLAIAAFVGGLVGYKSVVWLGLVAP